jgi:tetratricopeptide (TPR) repeat protein
VCAKKAGEAATAVAAYEQALELDPGYVEARYNYSLALMDVERYEDAVASFDSLLVIEPESYRAFYSQGLSLYYLGRNEDAIEAFEHALEQKETVNAYNNIGLAYDKLGDKKSAQTYYKEAKKLEGSQ